MRGTIGFWFYRQRNRKTSKIFKIFWNRRKCGNFPHKTPSIIKIRRCSIDINRVSAIECCGFTTIESICIFPITNTRFHHNAIARIGKIDNCEWRIHICDIDFSCDGCCIISTFSLKRYAHIINSGSLEFVCYRACASRSLWWAITHIPSEKFCIFWNRQKTHFITHFCNLRSNSHITRKNGSDIEFLFSARDFTVFIGNGYLDRIFSGCVKSIGSATIFLISWSICEFIKLDKFAIEAPSVCEILTRIRIRIITSARIKNKSIWLFWIETFWCIKCGDWFAGFDSNCLGIAINFSIWAFSRESNCVWTNILESIIKWCSISGLRIAFSSIIALNCPEIFYISNISKICFCREWNCFTSIRGSSINLDSSGWIFDSKHDILGKSLAVIGFESQFYREISWCRKNLAFRTRSSIIFSSISIPKIPICFENSSVSDSARSSRIKNQSLCCNRWWNFHFTHITHIDSVHEKRNFTEFWLHLNIYWSAEWKDISVAFFVTTGWNYIKIHRIGSFLRKLVCQAWATPEFAASTTIFTNPPNIISIWRNCPRWVNNVLCRKRSHQWCVSGCWIGANRALYSLDFCTTHKSGNLRNRRSHSLLRIWFFARQIQIHIYQSFVTFIDSRGFRIAVWQSVERLLNQRFELRNFWSRSFFVHAKFCF